MLHIEDLLFVPDVRSKIITLRGSKISLRAGQIGCQYLPKLSAPIWPQRYDGERGVAGSSKHQVLANKSGAKQHCHCHAWCLSPDP